MIMATFQGFFWRSLIYFENSDFDARNAQHRLKKKVTLSSVSLPVRSQFLYNFK